MNVHTLPSLLTPLSGSLPQSNSLWPVSYLSFHRFYLRRHTSLPPPPPNLRPTEKHTTSPVLHLAFFHLVGTSWRQLQTSTTRPVSFFSTLWCMPGVDRLQLMGQIWSAAYFCKYHLTESQPRSFVHVLSIATCELQRQSWEAATETIWSKKPKIFTILPFIENACWPLVCAIVWMYQNVFNLFPTDERSSGNSLFP